MSCLEEFKEALIEKMCDQIDNLDMINTKELYQVMDVIKDIEEAEYYHSIVEAMENKTSTSDNCSYDDFCLARHDYHQAKENNLDSALTMEALNTYLNHLKKEIQELLDEGTPDEKTMINNAVKLA